MLRLLAAFLGGFFVFASMPPAGAAAKIDMICYPQEFRLLIPSAVPVMSAPIPATGQIMQVYRWPNGIWQIAIIMPGGVQCPILGGDESFLDEEIIEIARPGEKS